MGIAKLYGQKQQGATIKGIIQDYYVYAGETVNVGDFVEFINGISKTEYAKSSAVSLGNEIVELSACAIDNERVFICGYLNGEYEATALVATISGGNITYGTAVNFTSNTTTSLSACLVDTNAVIVTYVLNNKAQVWLAKISGTTVIGRSATAIGTGESGHPDDYTQAVTLKTGVALLVWDRPYGSSTLTSYGLKACIVTVDMSGNGSYTVGTLANLEAGQHRYISLSAVSSTQALLSYSLSNSSNKTVGYSRMLSVSSSGTVSKSTAYAFNSSSEDTNFVANCLIDPTRALIVYQDGANSDKGAGAIAKISGNSISYGSEYIFNDYTIYSVNVVAINDNRVLLTFCGKVSSSGTSAHYALIASVGSTGTGISYGSKYLYNETVANSYPEGRDLCLVDRNKVFIVHDTRDSTDDTVSRLFGISDKTISDNVPSYSYETQVRTTTGTISGVAQTAGTGGDETIHGDKISIITNEFKSNIPTDWQEVKESTEYIASDGTKLTGICGYNGAENYVCNACDGNLKTYWRSNQSTRWIQLEFVTAKKVIEMSTYIACWNADKTDYGIPIIQASNDGNTWITQCTIQDPQTELTKLSLNNIGYYKYYRIYYSNTSASSLTICYEWKVFYLN